MEYFGNKYLGLLPICEKYGKGSAIVPNPRKPKGTRKVTKHAKMICKLRQCLCAG